MLVTGCQKAGAATLLRSRAGSQITTTKSLAACQLRLLTTRTANKPFFRERSSRRISQIVYTSEFWWEEEEEFDAITDSVDPKHVYIVVSHGDGSDGSSNGSGAQQQLADAACALLAPVAFQTGFCAPECAVFGAALWEGRSAPPFFKKMRERPSLGAAEGSGGGGGGAAAFWGEALGQNWRVELDYGLEAGKQREAHEAVLVAAPPAAVSALLALLGPAAAAATADPTTSAAAAAAAAADSGSPSSAGGGSAEAALQPGAVVAVVFRGGTPGTGGGGVELAESLVERVVPLGVAGRGAALAPL